MRRGNKVDSKYLVGSNLGLLLLLLVVVADVQPQRSRRGGGGRSMEQRRNYTKLEGSPRALRAPPSDGRRVSRKKVKRKTKALLERATTHSLSHSPTLSLSCHLTLALTQWLAYSHIHTLFLSAHSLPLSHTHAHAHSLSHALSSTDPHIRRTRACV